MILIRATLNTQIIIWSRYLIWNLSKRVRYDELCADR